MKIFKLFVVLGVFSLFGRELSVLAMNVTPPGSPSLLHKRKVAFPPSVKKALTPEGCPAGLVKLNLDSVSFLSKLGEGFFSSVYQGTLNDTLQVFKILKEGPSRLRSQVVSEFNRQSEAASVGAAPTPINSVFCTREDRNEDGKVVGYSLGFSMEFYSNSLSLERALIKITQLQPAARAIALNEIAHLAFNALDKIREIGLSHNDLAPENILVVGDSEGFSSIQKVLLIDFGLVDDDSDGHPQYHSQESLRVSNLSKDFISLVLVLLQSSLDWNYSRFQEKPSLTEIIDRVNQSQLFGAQLKVRMTDRLHEIHQEFLKDEANSRY